MSFFVRRLTGNNAVMDTIVQGAVCYDGCPHVPLTETQRYMEDCSLQQDMLFK